MTRISRLHGEAGGFVARGGHFRTPESQIRTSWREELAPYASDGERRNDYTGFRVVLAAAVLPNQARILKVRDALKKLHDAIRPVVSGNQHDPLEEIAALRKATDDPTLKTGLDQLRNDVTAEKVRSQDQENLAARSKLNLAVWLSSDILLETRPVLATQNLTGTEEARARVMVNYKNFLSYYRDTIQSLTQTYPLPLLVEQSGVLRQELAQRHPDQVGLIADVLADCGLYSKNGDLPEDSIAAAAKKKFCGGDQASKFSACQQAH